VIVIADLSRAAIRVKKHDYSKGVAGCINQRSGFCTALRWIRRTGRQSSSLSGLWNSQSYPAIRYRKKARVQRSVISRVLTILQGSGLAEKPVEKVLWFEKC
jgi:hypothetical protein